MPKSDTESVQSFASLLSSIDTSTLLIGVAILAIGLVLVRFLLHIVKKILIRTKIEPTLHSILLTLIRIVLDLVVILSAANAIGIPITSFVALLSVLTLAISLAVQGLLGNFVGGLIILASKPFEVGHFIEADGYLGTVMEINMLNTRMLAPDGKMIYFPNSKLQSSTMINYTINGVRRVELTIGVSYDCPPENVKEALLAAIRSTPGIDLDSDVTVRLETYGDSCITYTVLAWCQGSDFLTVKYALNERFYAVFKERGIIMTYPHLNVHMNQ